MSLILNKDETISLIKEIPGLSCEKIFEIPIMNE